MTHHPHIHMIVPGGGLSPDGSRWVSSRPSFLLPVRVLGKLFRRLFLTRLTALHEAGRLGFYGGLAHLTERRAFLRHLAPVRKKRWVVYAKPPFAGPEAVLAYLSRYTHRVAISNSRLLRFDETGVTFCYKDYRRSGADRPQVMTLAADEFIRRFLLHVLPKGFHRIRHYGLLAGATRKAQLERARELLGVAPHAALDARAEPDDSGRRHAHAAAGAWSSSKPSNASAGPAHRRLMLYYPGCRRRDPARPEGNIPRSADACGDDVVCADRRQRGNHNKRSRATRTGEPVTPAWNRPVRTKARTRVRRVAGHRSRPESENPIADRLWLAGSGFQDFRTPAGIRNSSGKRTGGF
jgi:hypothetical protein